jgi:hypothetical protein
VAEELGGRPTLEEALGRGHREDEALFVEHLQGGQGRQAAKAGEAKGVEAALPVGPQIGGHVLVVTVVLQKKTKLFQNCIHKIAKNRPPPTQKNIVKLLL